MGKLSKNQIKFISDVIGNLASAWSVSGIISPIFLYNRETALVSFTTGALMGSGFVISGLLFNEGN